tara:strand:+ start:43477 stop:44016 length:540 start_codon:yes stop_codon:yes gene_type:complete
MTIDLGKRISGGGTGAVHEGPDGSVYKITNGSEMANIDLLKEFGMLGRVNSITDFPTQDVIDAGRHEGRCFIQMKKIDGVPLDELLHAKQYTAQDIDDMRAQISDMHEQLADAGLYHGDAGGLGNYMVSKNAEGLKVRIIDFAEGGIDASGETARQEALKIDQTLERITPPTHDSTLAL